MADVQQAIRQLTIVVNDSGLDQSSQKLQDLTSSERDLDSVQQQRLTTMDRVNAQYKLITQAQQQLTTIQQRQSAVTSQQSAANDNQNSTLVNLAATIYIVKSGYDALVASLGLVGSAVDVTLRGIVAVAAVIPNAIGAVWQQGIDKLTTYVALSTTAGTLGTTFYQNLVNGAADAKVSTQSLLDIVGNLNKALTPTLGSGGVQNGSTFNTLVTQLRANGNLQGQQSEVSTLNNAVTDPEKLAAASALLKSMANDGQTLASLQIAGTILGPDAAKNLQNDSFYLDGINQSLQKASAAQIIKQADTDRAVGMSIALADAQKTIAGTQGLFGQLIAYLTDFSNAGVGIQQLWVNFNVNLAAALTTMRSIFSISSSVAAVKPASDSIWIKIGDFLNGGQMERMTDDARAMMVAQAALSSQLQNPANVANAISQTQSASDKLSPDISSGGGGSQATKDATTAIMANVAAVQLQTSVMGLEAGPAAAVTANAQLTAAAIRDGLNPAVEALTANWSLMVQQATDAANALDMATKLKAASDAYKSASDSVKDYIAQTQIAIKFNGDPSGLKQAQVTAQLAKAAAGTGMANSDPDGLAATAGALAGQLATLNATKDGLDRATDSQEKYITVTNAAADSVGNGVAAQQKAKTIADLTAAAMKDGVTDVSQYAAAWDDLGNKAGRAAQKLALTKVQDAIKFQTQTATLSPVDVQIATQLKGIYPDVTTALNSTEAAQIRLNDAIKATHDASTTFVTSFVDGLIQGKSAIQSLEGAAQSLVTTLANNQLKSFLGGGSLFGNQNLASGQGAVAVGAAGLAGYQSGNALTGALGGALAGASFGPVGAAVGGLVGAIGGLFGASNQAKQQLEQAKATWAASAPQFQAFLTSMTGGPQGQLAQQIAQAQSQMDQLETQAKAADDFSAVQQLEDAFAQHVSQIKQTFLSSFSEMTEALESGAGVNSPLIQAINNVQTQLTAALQFVNDTYTANHSQANIGGISTDITNFAPVKQAQDAEEAYLLSLLQTQPALSAVQQGLQTIQGTSGALQSAFEQLGISADDAAGAINQAVAPALANLATTFQQGLTSRLNTANGQDYLNSAQALLTQHTSDLTDAASLGGGQSMIDQVNATFAAEAQKLINDANLTGDQFTQFIDLFPQFGSVVTQATTTLTQSMQTIQQYLQSLQTGPNSILSPQDQLNSAEASFQQQFGMAQGGDSTALGSITQYADTVLNQAKSFYASGAGYSDIYNTVVAALSSLTGGTSTSSDTSLFGNNAASASSGVIAAAAPQITFASSSSDNTAALIGQQTSQLSQVLMQGFGGLANNDNVIGAQVTGLLTQLLAELKAQRGKPLRPNQKTGT
jgi:hypothetical protein